MRRYPRAMPKRSFIQPGDRDLNQLVLRVLQLMVAVVGIGFWLARRPLMAAVFEPYSRLPTRCPAWC